MRGMRVFSDTHCWARQPTTHTAPKWSALWSECSPWVPRRLNFPLDKQGLSRRSWQRNNFGKGHVPGPDTSLRRCTCRDLTPPYGIPCSVSITYIERVLHIYFYVSVYDSCVCEVYVCLCVCIGCCRIILGGFQCVYMYACMHVMCVCVCMCV